MKHIPFDAAFWKQLAIQGSVGTWMVLLFCWNADSADITELKSAIIGGAGIVAGHFGMAYLKPLLKRGDNV